MKTSPSLFSLLIFICILLLLPITNYALFQQAPSIPLFITLLGDAILVILLTVILVFCFKTDKEFSKEKETIKLIRKKFGCVTGSDQTFIVEYDVNKQLFTYWNEATGKPISTFSVEDYYKHIHADDIPVAQRLVEKMNNRIDEYIVVEYRWMFTGATDYSWQYNEIFPFKHDKDGKVTNYLAVCHRNNSKHELEVNIENFRKRVSFISISNGLSFIEYDVTNNLFYYLDNKSENADHIVPVDFWLNAIHPDDQQKGKELLEQLQQHSVKDIHTEYRYKKANKEDEYIWLTIDVSAYQYDSNNQITHYLILAKDNTVLHQAMDENTRLQSHAEMAQIQSIFLQNVNNKIRTPINAILGFSDLLCDEDSQEEKEKYKQQIKANTTLLMQIIENILSLSVLEKGDFTMNSRRFNLPLYLQQTIELYRTTLHESTVKLILKQHEDFIVSLDSSLLGKIMATLLNNAFKYTKEGSVTVDYAGKDNGLYISITDTGIGIAKENQERIFERFIKLSSASTGTGIGLAVCKAIILKFNGKIGVESELGKGSTFWFWIPTPIDK